MIKNGIEIFKLGEKSQAPGCHFKLPVVLTVFLKSLEKIFLIWHH